jgi:hypothetical protein
METQTFTAGGDTGAKTTKGGKQRWISLIPDVATASWTASPRTTSPGCVRRSAGSGGATG